MSRIRYHEVRRGLQPHPEGMKITAIFSYNHLNIHLCAQKPELSTPCIFVTCIIFYQTLTLSACTVIQEKSGSQYKLILKSIFPAATLNENLCCNKHWPVCAISNSLMQSCTIGPVPLHPA
jgi:hypothetical protein